MHRVAPELESTVRLPLLHIADATAEAIRERKLKTVGLLGTRPTMELEFYSGRLREKHELEVLIPNAGDREFVHRVIFDEICRGLIVPASATELSLLVSGVDSAVPLFDTTALHARKAVQWALEPADSPRGE